MILDHFSWYDIQIWLGLDDFWICLEIGKWTWIYPSYLEIQLGSKWWSSMVFPCIFPSLRLVLRTCTQPQAWVDAVVHQVLADQAVWVRCLGGSPCDWTRATTGRRYPLVIQHSHWKWPSIVSFPSNKCWFSLVTLVCQRVPKIHQNTGSGECEYAWLRLARARRRGTMDPNGQIFHSWSR